MTTMTFAPNPSITAHRRPVAAEPQVGARPTRRAVYRRRRIVAAVLAVMIAAVVVGVGSNVVRHVTGATTVAAADADVEPVRYVVQPGDTVWSIAAGLSDGDVRPVVDELQAVAGSSGLTAGQVLEIPGRLFS